MLERIAYSIDDRFRGGRPATDGSPKPPPEKRAAEVKVIPPITGSPALEPPPSETSTTVEGMRYRIRGS